MSINNVNRVKTIATSLPLENSSIQTIYSNANIKVGSNFIDGYKIISYNTFIKNLKAFASITSVEAAALPDFTLEDTATTKRMKVLDIEWKSPRKQLNLYISNSSTGTNINWLQVGSISLLNTFGYPFKVYNLMDLFTDNLALELGENSSVGLGVQDVGHGLLIEGDKVTVHGSYMEEIFTVTPNLPSITNIYVSGTIANTGNDTTASNSIDNDFLVNNTSLIGN